MLTGVKVFFRKTKSVNAPKKFKAQTIFVTNHASSFMDPWPPAELQNPILFFMTRGDIFKGPLKIVLWAAHMLPIYRTKENGADSAQKNEKVFREVFKILGRKKSIMIFAEGYTDDVFVRSLKPLKKGAARMAFGYMEHTNWQADLKIQSLGVNYGNPGVFRSDVLTANSEYIYVKEWKKRYEENPNKAVTDLTKEMEERLKGVLTYLENPKLTPLLDQIQTITKKGMAPFQYNKSIDLENRWRYSQKTASFLNENYSETDSRWQGLKTQLEAYFTKLEQKNINDYWLWLYETKGHFNTFSQWLFLLFGWPFFILGVLHLGIPYAFVKWFIERSFKRKVFWSSSKLLAGYLIGALFNIPTLFLFYHWIYPSVWLAFFYYSVAVPFIGVAAYNYVKNATDLFHKISLNKKDVKELIEKRKSLENQINSIGIK